MSFDRQVKITFSARVPNHSIPLAILPKIPLSRYLNQVGSSSIRWTDAIQAGPKLPGLVRTSKPKFSAGQTTTTRSHRLYIRHLSASEPNFKRMSKKPTSSRPRRLPGDARLRSAVDPGHRHLPACWRLASPRGPLVLAWPLLFSRPRGSCEDDPRTWQATGVCHLSRQ